MAAQFDNNNNHAYIPYTSPTVIVNAAHAESLPQIEVINQSLLLNSCSSMNLISNLTLLHTIG